MIVTRRPPPRSPVTTSRLGLVLWFAWCAAFVGCDPQANLPTPDAAVEQQVVEDQANSDFRVAMDFLDNFHEYESQQVTERIMYHLQKWAETEQPDPDWFADPLFRRLPERFAAMQQSQTVLSRIRFSRFDIMMLREALWTRDLARQVRERPLQDARLAAWLESLEGDIDELDLDDLETATKLVDWVVRNIQLEAIETGPDLPPAGAKYLPGEALLLGRGDWMVRARIATLMARQLGIPFTMLAIEKEEGEPQPWCLAAFIGKQLYLYDMQLGMPVPGPSATGVARLEQVIDSPELLRQLDDPDGEAYPITADDLRRVVALLEATPEYLSQRMKLVESRLSGDERLTLTVAPSPLGKELRACRGIGANVALWSVPFDTYLYRQQLRDFPPFMVEMRQRLALVDGPTPLASARRQHFRGIYADTDYEAGATTYYLECRVPDAEIERMKDPERMKSFLGAVGTLPKDPQALRAIVDQIRVTVRKAKQYASYWLGTIALDEGKYAVAEDYFKTRTLAASPDGPWTEGAQYNLGRTYEQMGLVEDDAGRLEQARQWYLTNDSSAQAVGNRVRAALLSTFTPAPNEITVKTNIP